MRTYLLSVVEMKGIHDEKFLKSLSKKTTPSEAEVLAFDDERNRFHMRIKDRMIFSIGDLGSFETEIVTDVFLYPTTRRSLKMISHPQGIGLMGRGSARRYVDSYVWSAVQRILGKGSHKPVVLPNSLLGVSKWKDNLHMIEFYSPSYRLIRLTTPDLSSKFETIASAIGQRISIKRVKVRAKGIRQLIELTSSGVAKTTCDNEELVLSFILERLQPW